MIQVFPITDSLFQHLVRTLFFAYCVEVLIVFVRKLIKPNNASVLFFGDFGYQIAGILGTLNDLAHHEDSLPLNGVDRDLAVDRVVLHVIEHKLLF